jgi:uncharacterized membrane-anchored protein
MQLGGLRHKLHPERDKKLNNTHKPNAETPKNTKHWLLWILLALFIVGSITAMLLADYYFAPGSNGIG